MKTLVRAVLLLPAVALAGCGAWFKREPRDAESLLSRARTEHLWNSDRHAVEYAERAAALRSASPADRERALRLSGEYRLYLGDEVGARERLDAALALTPDDPDALVLRARASREDPDEALTWVVRAQQAAAGAPPARRAALRRLAAEVRVDLEDDAGAERELKAALEAVPGDLDALRALARVEKRAGGDAASFARAAEKSADDAPEWLRPAARRYAARVWRDLDDGPRAAAAYRRVLELAPEDLESLRALLELSWQDPKDPVRALPDGAPPRPAEDSWTEWTPEALAAAERLDPDGIEALRLRAARAWSKGRKKEAAREADRLAGALWRAPLWQQASAEVLAARMELDLRDEGEAALRLASAFRLEPHSIPAWRLETRLKKARESSRLSVSVLHSQLGADQVVDPSASLALEYRDAAEVRWALGDEAGARRALALALEAVPGDPPALALSAKIDAARGAAAPAAAPRPDGLTALEEAVRDGGLSPEEALAALLKSWPGEGAPGARRLALRAAVAARLNDADAPPEGLRRLAELVPGDPRGWSLLVRSESRRSRTKAALADAERLVSAARGAAVPERTAALRQRARLRLDGGDDGGAAADLRDALSADPNDLDALELLVWSLSGRPGRALAEVESRWPASPRPLERWRALRGLARLRASGWEAARADLEAAFAADPDRVCRSEFAVSGRGRYEPGYFDLCLRRYPRDASLYADRGVALYRAGRRDAAVADFRRALELEPGNRSARLSLEAAGAVPAPAPKK